MFSFRSWLAFLLDIIHFIGIWLCWRQRGSYVPSLWRRIWYQSTPSRKMQCSCWETKKTIRKTYFISKRIKTV